MRHWRQAGVSPIRLRTSKPISLPDPIWQLIHRKVESGEYSDESEYIAKLAEADLHRQKLEAWDKFRGAIQEGMDSPLVGLLKGGEVDDIVRRASARVQAERNTDPA